SLSTVPLVYSHSQFMRQVGKEHNCKECHEL
ncbi:hypothetical protein CMV_027329, partial [Castanea mollissima]